MAPQQSLSPRAWGELFALALLWGGSFLAFAVALRDLPVFTVVAIRVALAAALLWVVVLARRLPLPSGRQWGACLVMGLLNNAIPFTLIAWGQTTIESGLASILNASTAIFGVLVAALVFSDERLTGRRLTGVVIGFAGVAVVIGPGVLAGFDLRSLAQLAILGSSLSYAFAGAWARATMKGLRPQVASAAMLTGSTAIMVPLALTVDGLPPAMPGLPAITALGYISIAATAGAYLLYYRVLAMAGAGNLLLVTLLVAPIAVLLGALVLGEALSHTAFAGFALLALGLLILDGRLVALLTRISVDPTPPAS